MRYQIAQSEAGDWYVVPEGRGDEFRELALDGEIPEWARYVNIYSLTFENWE